MSDGKDDRDLDKLLGDADIFGKELSLARDAYEKKPPTKETLTKLSAIKDTMEKIERRKLMIIKEFEIRQTMKAIREAQNVDICFMVDCTGSMCSYIAAVKTAVKDFVAHLKAEFPGLEMRYCFLGYRDFCDDASGNHFSILDFTSSRTDFERFVGGVVATGGGDAAEDVNGAFQEALKLKWKNAVRVLFHIADAPPHGRTYYVGSDDHPDGHPKDKPIEELFRKILQYKILYLFGRINSLTDKMLEVFRATKLLDIEQADLSAPTKLLDSVTKFTEASVTASISATLGHDVTSKRKMRTGIKVGRFYLDARMRPDTVPWGTLKNERVTVWQFIEPEEMEDLEADLKLGDSSTQTIQISEKPFAKGAMRLAYAARIDDEYKHEHSSLDDGVAILKEYFDGEQRVQDRSRTVYEMEVGTIARFLAREFEHLSRKHYGKPIEFVPIKMVEFGKRASGDCFVLEPYLNADFQRFSNNGTYLREGEEYWIFQTFTHWTYCITGKKLMVVDLEGTILPDKIVLTDPALHSTQTLRFGKTNLGTKGMQAFLKLHRCNKYCKEVIPGKDLINPL